MKARVFDTWRDPYNKGYSMTRPKRITLNEGLTVFVGCNGSGKSTLLDNIREELFNESTPVLYFDNIHDGEYCSKGSSYQSKISKRLVACSEGEAIQLNIGQIARTIKQFLINGLNEDDLTMYSELSIDPPSCSTNERFILLDSIDSGYSLDNIQNLKELFNLILEDGADLDLDVYIVVTANGYDLAEGQHCFDVMEGKYITFDNYNDYKAFILKCRQKRDKHIKSATNKNKRGQSYE